MCTSDGGVLLRTGAFAWKLRLSPNHLISCTGPADSRKDSNSSARAELYGILSFSTFLKLFCEYFNIHSTRLRFVLRVDSRAAITAVNKAMEADLLGRFHTTSRCTANYDLVAEILTTVKNCPAMVDLLWIEGHLLKRKKWEELTPIEKQHHETDVLCGETLEEMLQSGTIYDDVPHFPSQLVSILHHSRRVTGDLRKQLRYLATAPLIESYWIDKFGWDPNIVDNLDRDSFASVFKNLKASDQRRIIQLRCNWLPVSKRVAKWCSDRQPECHRCPLHCPESVDHLLQCPEGRHLQEDFLTDLHNSLSKAGWDPMLITTIRAGLRQWLFHPAQPDLDFFDLPQAAQDAANSQAAIGWGNLLRGFMSKTWIDAQSIMSHHRIDTPDHIKLGKALISSCLSFFLKVWAHRNDLLHGANPEERKQRLREKLQHDINYYWSQRDTILPRDQAIMFHQKTREELLESPLLNQQAWLAYADGFFPRAVARKLHRQQHGQTHITEFFQAIPQANEGS